MCSYYGITARIRLLIIGTGSTEMRFKQAIPCRNEHNVDVMLTIFYCPQDNKCAAIQVVGHSSNMNINNQTQKWGKLSSAVSGGPSIVSSVRRCVL